MDIEITVDEVISPSNSKVQRIGGTYNSEVASILVNGSSDGVFLEVDNTWHYDAILGVGENRFEIQGADISNAKGATSVIVIEFNSVSISRVTVTNHLDEYGLQLNVPRISGEKNLHYKNRLLDYSEHPGGPEYPGMLNNIARSLSMKIVDDAMTITLSKTADSFNVIPNGIIWSNTKYIYIETREASSSNNIFTIPSTKQIIPEEKIVDTIGVIITTLNGNEMDRSEWEFDRDDNSITFSDDSNIGRRIKLEYLFMRRIDLKGKTVQQVADEMLAILDGDGNPIFDITVNSVAASGMANHLSHLPFSPLVPNIDVVLRWTPFRFFQLHEEDVWRSELNEEGTIFGTDLESWIKFINENANVTWERVRLDRDAWIGENQVNLNTFSPHLLDNKKGTWQCSNPIHTTEYDIHGFKSNNEVCPEDGLPLVYTGVFPLEFQSGVGFDTDLKVSIVESDF